MRSEPLRNDDSFADLKREERTAAPRGDSMEGLVMNVPNALSFLRLLLVPVFVLVFFSDVPGALYWAAGIYLFAGLTDIVDGAIARKFNMITRLGRVIDPLADKLMQVAVFVCMAVKGFIPVWVILILAAKEAVLLVGGAKILHVRKDIPSSNIYGKAAACIFYAVTLAIIVFRMPQWLDITLLSGALSLSIAALLIYWFRNRHLLYGKENKAYKERNPRD